MEAEMRFQEAPQRKKSYPGNCLASLEGAFQGVSTAPQLSVAVCASVSPTFILASDLIHLQCMTLGPLIRSWRKYMGGGMKDSASQGALKKEKHGLNKDLNGFGVTIHITK